jgi:DNA-binding IscR family transcriptional regulator
VSVAEIQHALGERVVSLTSKQELPRCLVLRAVVHSLDEAMLEAERALDRRLAALSLADLAADVGRLHAAQTSNHGDKSHAV